MTQRELVPYVPPLLIEWLADRPTDRHRPIDCTLVFADISGFTRMTELLGSRGRVGAEEMAEVINGVFAPLFAAAYARGGQLIKWGGDATLMMFDGPDHARRACRAAWDMQRVRREGGSAVTARGRVRLGMSIGVHSGTYNCFLLGNTEHRELVICGPDVTTLTGIEKRAAAGQIMLSSATAQALVEAGEPAPQGSDESGHLLRRAPTASAHDGQTVPAAAGEVDLAATMCQALREHILAGGLESDHRHVAVGFVKVSGIDRLRAREGLTVAAREIERALQAVQNAAVTHDVTFLATDVGPDSFRVMLSAGAPHHAGHDERRLIAALLEAVDSDGTLPLHAGVTSGRVFAGDFGPSYRRTYSVMGDCVNLAARLMEHAGRGELLATEQLASTVGPGAANARGTSLSVKGKRAPVAVWRITAAEARATEEPDSEPLIGREDELATLLAAARAAGRGSGQVITLIGEPGMGKSKLLSELSRLVPGQALYTSGDVYGRSRPYDPFQRLVRACLELDAVAPAAAVSERLTVVTRERAPHLTPWLSLIGIVAGVDIAESREVAQTDVALRKQLLEEMTSELLGAILTEPTTLILDDVHLMDDASRDLIARLAGDAVERPWLVVISHRAGQSVRLAGAGGVTMTLGPLSDAGARQLLALATASAPMPPHRLAEVARRSGGNPLFMRALVAQLTDGGDASMLPTSVEEAIAARIDRLTTPDRQTLRAAAVLGIEVETELLGEVMNGEWPEGRGVRHALGALNEFLEPVGDRQWHFRHQLMREVAYEGLPYRRRSDLHRRTADAIERAAGGRAEEHAELLSLHCFHGGRFEDAWRYLLRAARGAHARYANAEAAESYRLALRAAAHVPGLGATELAEVDAALGDICIELGELRAADVALRRALRRVKNLPAERAGLQLKLARLRDLTGQHRAALSWTNRADTTLEGLDGPEEARLRGQLAMRRVRNSYQRGHHAEALALAERATELARAAGDRRTLAEALEHVDICAGELGLPTKGRAAEALRIYGELGDLAAQARVNNTLGLLAYHRGEWAAAIDHYTVAERAYAKSGRLWDSATPMANRAEILIDQGHLDGAREDLERAIQVWRGVDAASEIAFGEYQLGRIAARQGEGAEAMRLLRSARAHFRASGEQNEVIVVDSLIAECLLLTGEPDAALAAADRALARAHSLGGRSSATPLLHRIRGGALQALGRRPEAGLALRAALGAARERSALHEIAFALMELIHSRSAGDAAEGLAWREELGPLVGALGLVVRSRRQLETRGSLAGASMLSTNTGPVSPL
jgi:class 3 adenylate cyclase/tetratricopeptide (TPR) repeat protein